MGLRTVSRPRTDRTRRQCLVTNPAIRHYL